MATRSQLQKLEIKCRYLKYYKSTPTKGSHVESFSGSLEMFSPKCGFRKVIMSRHRTRDSILDFFFCVCVEDV